MTKQEFDNRETAEVGSGWAAENLLQCYIDTADAQYIKESLFEYMSKEDLKMYDSFPGEITIYRGCDLKEDIGQSWTISLETAKWFAFRANDNESRIVIEAKIYKKDIFAYTNQRREYEVIVDVSKLRNQKQITSFDKDEYIANIIEPTPPICSLSNIEETRKRQYKKRLMRLAKKRFKRMKKRLNTAA